jgi:ABC-type sugar transport system permease subunit
VVSVLWSFFYSGDGLFNAVLQDLRLPTQPFLQSTAQAMPALVAMSIWQGVGYQMILFLAGLQGIPEQLYEASTIDGASRFAQFWLITIPQLRNTIVFVVVITTTFAFKLFTQVYVMTGGGPFGVTRTIIFELVQSGIQYSRLGYGSAMAAVFFLLVMLIQVLQRALIREERA